MSDYIPIEIQIKILERLPVKSLVRFSLVCKSWYSLIRSPTFIKAHLHLSASNSNGNVLLMPRELRKDCENVFTMLSESSLAVHHTFNLKLVSDYQSLASLFNTGNCCNGVVCLTGIHDPCYKVILFNASIRKLKVLPLSSILYWLLKLNKNFVCNVGFCYDQKNDDYKVLRVYRICKDREKSDVVVIEDYRYDVKVVAEIYSLRNDAWRRVEVNDHSYFDWRCVSVNGAIHWLSSNDDEGEEDEVIVAFDFHNEVFREIVLPKECLPRCSFLLLYKGFLSILVTEEVTLEESNVSLWVMKEYGQNESWKKQFTGVIHRQVWHSFDFTKNGKLIFMTFDSDEPAIWDPESGQLVDLVGFSVHRYNALEDYVESLALL